MLLNAALCSVCTNQDSQHKLAIEALMLRVMLFSVHSDAANAIASACYAEMQRNNTGTSHRCQWWA
jgi:hypothetical protein